MQISTDYFNPLNSIFNGNCSEIKCNALNVLIIASYFSLIVPAIFLIASCLEGRVKPVASTPRDKEISKKILEDNKTEPKNDSEAKDLFEQGLKLHKEKNRKDAMPFFTKAAEKGHVDANYYLGKYHQFGIGSKKFFMHSWNATVPFYEKAAEQGNTKAQYRLGSIHSARQEKSEALKYYIPAAENGNKKAQHSLAQLYLSEDPAKALTLLNASAAQNYHQAFFDLSKLYKRGEIVQKDPKKEIEYLQKAMDEGSSFAAYDLAHKYLYGQDVEIDLEKALDYYLKSRGPIGDGSFESEIKNKFLKKAAEGDVQALYRLGQIYHLFMYQGTIEAITYYKKAADENHVLAKEVLNKLIDPFKKELSDFDHLVLGAAYEVGANVDKNMDKAIEHYKLSTEREAMLHLAKMYHHGVGVQKNSDEAIKFYAAAAGDHYEPEILYTIAELYEYEKNNLERALPLYIRAAHNWPKGMLKLASLYATGNHVQKDLKKAREYVARAEKYKGSAQHDDHALACFYMSETDLKDLAKAKIYMQAAAAQGYKPA